jgi:hypothetical protein
MWVKKTEPSDLSTLRPSGLWRYKNPLPMLQVQVWSKSRNGNPTRKPRQVSKHVSFTKDGTRETIKKRGKLQHDWRMGIIALGK